MSSSMDLLIIADINAEAVALYDHGLWNNAKRKMIKALKELRAVKKKRQHSCISHESIKTDDTTGSDDRCDDDDDDVKFEDGTYRCFSDTPLNSKYDNMTYSVFNSMASNKTHSHVCYDDAQIQMNQHDTIYSSVFLLSGDIPIVEGAVSSVLLYNMALFFHQQGLHSSNIKHSIAAYKQAHLLYEKASNALQSLYHDKPILMSTSMALQVLSAAIYYNLTHIVMHLYCNNMVAMKYMIQFQSHVQSILNDYDGEENLTTTDFSFFQKSVLFFSDISQSHLCFSAAA